MTRCKVSVETFINGVVEVDSFYEDCQVTEGQLIDFFENNYHKDLYANGRYWGFVHRFVNILLGTENKFTLDNEWEYQLPENIIYNTLKEVYEHNKRSKL